MKASDIVGRGTEPQRHPGVLVTRTSSAVATAMVV
jgi:hypothetical protein